MRKILFFLLMSILVASCSGNVKQTLDLENKFYKRDVRMLFEGTEYFGVAVLPARAKYNLELTFIGELDMYTFRSCHRETTQEDAGGGKIFGKKNKVSIVYEPTDIERKHCPIEVSGYTKDKGRHSWGFIDFETPLETMSAIALYNGQRIQFNGVSVCQSLHGLRMQLIVKEKSTVESQDDCPLASSKDGLLFDVLLGAGRCVYSFYSEKGNWHRLTNVGYQDIIVKNVE